MQEAFRMLAVRGVHWYDVLDVLAVALLFFFVLRQVRGTRALQMLLGVLALAVANVASGWLKMTATHRLLQNLLFYIPFAIIVLFQEPIQKALAKLGSIFFGRGATLAVTRRVASETAQASFTLAGRRHGALIIFERTQGLKDIEETGIKVDAGAKDLAGHPEEKITEGLDGLRERLTDGPPYREQLDRAPRLHRRDPSAGPRNALRKFARDRNDPSHCFNIVFFDSYESAMENSSLPETQAMSEKMAAVVTGPPTFYDLDVVQERS